jgi:hypothetical protein
LAAGTAAFAATTTSSSQAASACVSKAQTAPREGSIAGIVSAVGKSGCAGNTANGTPPLIWHGGAVMATPLTGPLVITPIFWTPAGHPMDAAYKSIITQYLSDVAHASGRTDNVYSTATEYSGTDGTIRYQIQLGTPITATNPLPANGCKLMHADMSAIYADGTGYDACIDDSQVIAETNSVVAAGKLPRNLSHIYVLFLPKHVESCFFAGAVSTAKNACTINYEPSAAFCAYHSQFSSNTVYANMPFPIYTSPVGFTCSSDARVAGFGGVQAPNGNKDADTEVSPTSHEVMEAMTDPDTNTGWFDSSGFENGDECAYVFGPVAGTKGAFYNQTINGNHYLTQEEFSNNSFFASGGGCLQGENAA